MSWKPYDGGIYLEHIVKMDPAGMIPDFIKNKAATRMTNTLLIITEYLMHGTIPDSPF